MNVGYFVLGGASKPPPLPLGDLEKGLKGNHTASRTGGDFFICCDYPKQTVNIPTRDKRVDLWSPNVSVLAEHIATLDSQPGENYRAKLLPLLKHVSEGVINNISTANHGSIALLGLPSFYGLHDNQSGSSYLVWCTEEDLNLLLIQHPLRYLVFRFPSMKVVFIPCELLCSKWWRWTKSHSLLHAFNALEMRLNNGPSR